jgi:hypothetical protein
MAIELSAQKRLAPLGAELIGRHRPQRLEHSQPLLRELPHSIPRLVAVGARVARGRRQARISRTAWTMFAWTPPAIP